MTFSWYEENDPNYIKNLKSIFCNIKKLINKQYNIKWYLEGDLNKKFKPDHISFTEALSKAKATMRTKKCNDTKKNQTK